jgi:sec-independent protein translocase protein TatA
MLQLEGVGGVEWLYIIIVLAVLFFGVNKIPKIARSFGIASAEYEKARIQAYQELKQVKPQKDTNINVTVVERKKT